MKFHELEESVWTKLADEKRPIALYGMGDGADKILREFEKYDIKLSAVFASDEFVRGHSFRGFKVKKLAEVCEMFGKDIVIVVAFATQRQDVMERIYQLDEEFDLVAPDVPVIIGDIFDEKFAKTHEEEMQRAFSLLQDQISRDAFLDTVRFKLSGKIKYLKHSETGKKEVFETILQRTRQEHFVDLGAYTGDTIRELLSYTDGEFASITALEPDNRNFRKLMAYADENLSGDVNLVQAGAWSEDAVLRFSAKAGRQSKIEQEGKQTQMRSVDSVLAGKPCTMLKMDVEGAEKEAILGARRTIEVFRPKLNIAAYHRSCDFFSLMLLLHEICPEYRFYLRHHPYIPAWDTNLYAICP